MGDPEEPDAGAVGAVAKFYDGFAADYHLAYGGSWEAAVDRQAAALDRLIRALVPGAQRVLDCSCGIGTQAIGLARLGYRVWGTDISSAAIERAGAEAERLGASLSLAVADFRQLREVEGEFDVVVSCDNAIPHLLSETDVTALASMRAKLRRGGLLVITMRDFDRALIDRPPIAPPRLASGPPRRLLLRLHDWDPHQPVYTLRYLVLTESETGWSIVEHTTRYRAITKAELERAAARAGLEEVEWPDEVIVGGQLVATARRGKD
jgi:glycine/sarcosine N-methyltransferase